MRILSLTVILNIAFLSGFLQAHMKNITRSSIILITELMQVNTLTSLLIFYLKVHDEKRVQPFLR